MASSRDVLDSVIKQHGMYMYAHMKGSSAHVFTHYWGHWIHAALHVHSV